MRIHASLGAATALCGDVILVVWSRPPQLPAMRYVLARAQEFLEELAPDAVLVLQVVLPAPGRPDREAFQEAGQVIRRLRSRVRRFTSVALGKGVGPTIVRAVLRTIAIAAGSRGEMVIESTVEDGLERVRQAASARTPEARRLAEAIEALTKAAAATP